ncbi:MAG: hypothetical protein KC621_21185 [Myxococcales bacterium]|nr:hypothetical protein [Myxococcales bacterium]
MFLLLAHAALADDTPAPKTYTPAPKEQRTVAVLMMWNGGMPFPSAAWLDGEQLGCPIPCTAMMSPGEHEMTVAIGKDSKTFLIDVPDARIHKLTIEP